MHPVFFDGNVLETLLIGLMDGHVTYDYGAKCSRISRTEPANIQSIDCSGLVEYLFYRISNPHTDIPSGSSKQEDWFEERYTRVSYQDAARFDSHLRVAFRDRRGDVVRHVWFTVNGRTIESTARGDHNGPSSLPWDARLNEASDCFLLGPLLPMRFDTSWIPSPGVAAAQGVLGAAAAGAARSAGRRR
jgi:hypothetical protein